MTNNCKTNIYDIRPRQSTHESDEARSETMYFFFFRTKKIVCLPRQSCFFPIVRIRIEDCLGIIYFDVSKYFSYPTAGIRDHRPHFRAGLPDLCRHGDFKEKHDAKDTTKPGSSKYKSRTTSGNPATAGGEMLRDRLRVPKIGIGRHPSRIISRLQARTGEP